MGLFKRVKHIGDIEKRKFDKKRKAKKGIAEEEPEFLVIGGIGILDGMDFTVLGKLEYDWGGGGWAEYYIEFPDTNETKWLSVEGNTMELMERVRGKVLHPTELEEGQTFDFEGDEVLVDEIGNARVVEVKGEFPWNLKTGANIAYADCIIEATDEVFSIEASGSEIEAYRGHEVSRSSLEIL